MRPWILVVVLCLALAGCSRSGVFHCTEDPQCSAGRCEPTGFCSVADGACPSGFRYDDTAGVDPGACVAPGSDVDATVSGDARLADASWPDARPDAAPPGARNPCAEGFAIPAETSDCVEEVCAAQATCCARVWDELCVQLVETTPACARSCGQVAYTGDNERFGGRRIIAGSASEEFTAFEDNFADEPGSGPRINKVAVADYDSDGRPDFAASSPHGWYVLHNESDAGTVRFRIVASHQAPTEIGGHHIAWADWDGDDDLDLAVTNLHAGLYLVRHDPGAAMPFVQEAEPLLPMTQGGAALAFDWGDLDEDGDVDLVAAQDRRGVVLRNDGGGRFQRVDGDSEAQFGIRLCDLVGSSLPEVVTATFAGPIHVYASTAFPTGQPSLAIPAPRTQNYRDLRCADLDGDRDLDVVAGSETGAMPVVHVFANQGLRDGLATEPAWTLEHRTDLDAMDIGDLDGDRRLDLVISYDNTLRWLVNATPAGGTITFSHTPAPIDNIGEYALDLGPEPLR